jgi:hypothetical protein
MADLWEIREEETGILISVLKSIGKDFIKGYLRLIISGKLSRLVFYPLTNKSIHFE